MAGNIDRRIAELGLKLPSASPAFATYLPWKVSRGMAYISGQGPLNDGKIVPEYCGVVGADMSVATAQEAARLTALNVVAQLEAACGGDLDRVTGCVQIMGFVNCVPGYTETPTIVNGGSDVIVEIFGDIGRHARFAVGSHALPVNIAVELAAIFEID
jgi:enamine deaminase RidA (YjgF/YER057c/UK114 family)